MSEMGQGQYPAEGSAQAQMEEEHLRTLTIGFYVVGAIIALFSSFFIGHVVIGILTLTHPHFFAGSSGNTPPGFPEFFGYFFLIMGSMYVILGWTLAICTLLAGRFLRQRRNYMYILVVAGLICLIMPLGTALGVFTFILLLRPSVRARFPSVPVRV